MRSALRPRIAFAVFMLWLVGCQPADDPAARDGEVSDSAPETDGGDIDAAPDPEADAAPDPEPEPDGSPEPEPDGSPEPEPDGSPDLGPDAAPPAECGNGAVEGDEGCDDGAENSDERPDACRTDCQPARCGDGVVDAPELCDGERTCDPDTCLPACADACDAPGAAVCDAGGVSTCGDHDDDPCYEWSPPTACAEDEACAEGVCVCVDTCAEGAVECVGDGARRPCLPQADGCLGWSPAEDCGAFEACAEGVCEPVPPPAVLINEVLANPPGADRGGAFIELWGPPGTSLVGLTVQGINGNGGNVVDEMALDGSIGEDGFYVLAHPEAEEALRALADQLDVDADLQNGPDSVRIVRGELVIDALAYGDFADAVFAGEGRPAPAVADLALTRDADHSDTDDNFTDFTAGIATPRGDPPRCEDACEADALRCLDAALEACRPGPEGCLVWSPEQDCAADGLVCLDGTCAPGCEDACDVEDDGPRCADDSVEACQPGPDGCAAWQIVEDCAADGLGCIDGVCAAGCEDACDPEVDGPRCAGDANDSAEECQLGPEGCAVWQTVEECAADDLVCDGGGCVCLDACAVDAVRCGGDAVEQCIDIDGCLGWAPVLDCAGDGGICRDGACEDPPRCGDGVVDPDEACDDGNLDLGDGCDDRCAEEDPFDQRAVLVVRAPPAGERPDHVPDNIGGTTYAPGLTYDNAHYFVYEAFDDNIREQVAQVPLGQGLRLEPGDYAVVINDSFMRVVVDWNDRVEIGAGRLEVRSPERGTYTLRPPRRFDDIATALPLRGCGQFGNQDRSRWIFGGCDGEIGGGALDLDTGIVLLPLTYRAAVDARYHSPNDTFVEVRPGEVTVYEPADTRARIELVPTAGDLPDWQIEPMPTYGTSNRRFPAGNDSCQFFRFIDIVAGFEHIGSGCAGGSVVVPAGRYHITLNDTYVVRNVAAGEHLVIPTGRIEIVGAGTFDIEPDPNVRRFTFIDNPVECSRNGPETYLLAHCFLEEPDGVFPRGSGVTVLPGSYEVRIYDDAGGLLQTRPFEIPDVLPE